MRITSWNVNGLRRLIPLHGQFEKLDSDIICLQETRISGLNDDELESLAFIPGYDSYFSICKTRPGYSGVVTFCRRRQANPVAASSQLADDTGGASIPLAAPCDQPVLCPCGGNGYTSDTLEAIRDEGRCVITDHVRFVLINVYVPAVSVEHRITFKMAFLHALRAKVDALRNAERHVIVIGDFNICPARIDSAERMQLPDSIEWNRRPSRLWLSRILHHCDANFVDVFRQTHPHRQNAYTCWSEVRRGRETNFGVRIDLAVVDRAFYNSDVEHTDIWPHITGSDHCPISIKLYSDAPADYPDMYSQRQPPRLCSQFLPRFAKRQQSITHFTTARSTKCETSFPGNSIRNVPLGLAIRKRATRQLSRNKLTSAKCEPMQSTLTSFLLRKNGQPNSVRKRENTCNKPNDSPQSSLFKFTDVGSTDLKRKEVSQAWRTIFSSAPPPPCRHGKPCILKTVNKGGENKGRTFFCCAYPSGVGDMGNCNYFQWTGKDPRPLPSSAGGNKTKE